LFSGKARISRAPFNSILTTPIYLLDLSKFRFQEGDCFAHPAQAFRTLVLGVVVSALSIVSRAEWIGHWARRFVKIGAELQKESDVAAKLMRGKSHITFRLKNVNVSRTAKPMRGRIKDILRRGGEAHPVRS